MNKNVFIIYVLIIYYKPFLFSILLYFFKFYCDKNSTAIIQNEHDLIRYIDSSLAFTVTKNQTGTATENSLVMFLILLTIKYIGFKYFLFFRKYT
jgi:hypothetical protein